MSSTFTGFLVVGVLLAGAARRASAAEIVGHRGAAYDAPENTLASVKLAWKQGADAAEIDVHLTADGQIVSFHDADTKRIGGRNKPVVQQTLAELQTLDAGAWKNAKYAGERIPTLAQVLDTIPEGKRLFIEIKCGPEIVPELARVLKAAGKKPEQTALISFSYEVMVAAKKQFPDLEAYWIVRLKENEQTRRWEPPVEELIEKARAANLDGLDLGMGRGISAEFVSEVKQAGLGFYTWTVNSVDDARNLDAWGADGITTDRPGWLREGLAGNNAK